MRTFLWFLLLAWILGFTRVDAFADPRVAVKIKYYEVEGDTVEELKNELKVKTPIRNNGKPFDANTTWYVKWNTQWAMRGMSCGIVSVTTRVSIIFTLPKRANYKEHSGKEREKWEKLFKRLVDHENGHKDIAVGSAKELEKSILDMESRESCDDLKRDANRLGETIIEKYQGFTEQYDLETDHGRKQNASAPWNEISILPPAR